MEYIWINPVTDSMYETDKLNEFLYGHGYIRFDTSVDWLTIVKEKYRFVCMNTSNTVMDVRCPKIMDLLSELDIISKVSIPRINPILIHCGQESSIRKDIQNEKKIITTPCEALANMGNALGLKDTEFITWNKFIKLIGDEPSRKKIHESPIPPGFFNELGLNIMSITGEDDIRDYFQNNDLKDVDLVEMLYCKEGCHNGDGIRRCK